jgi:hypothetical protein
MYIRQAYYDASCLDFSKRVISVTAKDGDNVSDYVLREVRQGIIGRFTALAAGMRDEAEVSDQRINAELEARERDEGPTFVALPPNVVEDYDLLDEIQGRYPSLVLILFTGPDGQTLPDIGIEFLEPLLSPGEEDTAQITYNRCCDLLR